MICLLLAIFLCQVLLYQESANMKLHINVWGISHRSNWNIFYADFSHFTTPDSKHTGNFNFSISHSHNISLLHIPLKHTFGHLITVIHLLFGELVRDFLVFFLEKHSSCKIAFTKWKPLAFGSNSFKSLPLDEYLLGLNKTFISRIYKSFNKILCWWENL